MISLPGEVGHLALLPQNMTLGDMSGMKLRSEHKKSREYQVCRLGLPSFRAPVAVNPKCENVGQIFCVRFNLSQKTLTLYGNDPIVDP